MKVLWVTICAVSFLASPLQGQRGGGGHGGGGGIGHGGVTHGSGSIFSRSNFGGKNFGGRAFRNFGGGTPWIYPAFYYDDFDNGNPFYNDYPESSNTYIVMPQPQAPPPEPPPPPPPPPAAMIREYHWPAQTDAPEPFSIVATNGTTYYATMVWREGDRLHFQSTEGGARQIPMSSVSRSLTQAANAKKNLTLPLQ
jgi:hypothetical protein